MQIINKTTRSENQLLVDRLIRIDNGYFERDRGSIVPVYHLICTQTGDKLAKVELISTEKHVISALELLITVNTKFTYKVIVENLLTNYSKTVKRREDSWVYVKFLFFLDDLVKDGSFEETIISLFP